ncbi:SusD/RagB family nutrient-binding outer membrane lipoprotein [Fodinibius halophilus]|uniref:SusD/RagB family nutrient-binding outer membrane lipoprotein n=1 Tax=Fodinibius halophilus TaxID=1736908 RepID=A0A6M1T6S4_9BACT|nr:SusD/RagB family nutrient-binding outer membrane lipoprotein [Fodinibius halophilus]NGP89809.1 SusD/RagB family nutrient-binding outer membrane lipoprotein [Fodinibius halophilus]
MNKLQQYITTLVCILVVFVFGACENYLGGDTNKDPNRVFKDEIGLDALLPPVLVSTSKAHFDIAFTFSQYSQHISFVGETDSHEEAQLAGAWVEIYLSSLNNLDEMEQKAKETGASHYLGIVKVMQAYNLSLATNTWENIPWSDAFKEGEFSPSYDNQQEIYNAIDQLLNEGITELEKAPSEFNEPGSDDIIYGGNIDKWIKTAYALKARNAIHVTEQGAVAAADNALSALSNAYTSNADDFQINYNNEKNLNPWHTSAYLAAQTGNPAPVHSDQLIDMMNGETYPEADPRLPIIADNGGDTDYYGSENGNFGVNEDAPDNSSNTAFTDETFHSRAAAPIIMMTYAEMKFIEAEAAFLKANNGSESATGASQQAYDAYLAGISANMDKLGVSANAKNNYINAASVDVGAGNLTMELIMKEKFKALFLNPEVYNDYRRYDFDSQIFKDLALPADHNDELDGVWIQRAVYPSSELSRNQEEVKKAQKSIATPMWFYN